MPPEYEERTKAEVAEWPGAAVTFGHRAKHREATLSFRGESRFVIMPTSPSDGARGLQNHIAAVRRELRSLGASRAAEERQARPRRHRNPGARQRPMTPCEPAPVRPDPWEALRKLKDRPRRWRKSRWLLMASAAAAAIGAAVEPE
jgi:hypothetical protein